MPDAVRLSVVRFGGCERERWLAAALTVLGAAERARVAAIRDADARAQHAVGRALLRVVAARAAGCAPGRVEVALTESGKPWLPQVPGLHVSLAHTGRTVALAACPAAPVGVDIEPPRPQIPDARRLVQRRFAAAEASAVADMPEATFADWFVRAWTVKEAVGKALGTGVVPALSGVRVATAPGGFALVAVAGGPPAAEWTLHELRAPGGPERIAVALPVSGVPLAPVSVVGLDRFRRCLGAHGATARTCSGFAAPRALR